MSLVPGPRDRVCLFLGVALSIEFLFTASQFAVGIADSCPLLRVLGDAVTKSGIGTCHFQSLKGGISKASGHERFLHVPRY